jgi:hypothetical protein
MKKHIIAFAWLLLSQSTMAQDMEPSQINDLVEQQATSGDTESENIEQLENYEYYIKHPLNLNKATIEQLRECGFLNELQMIGLINYRKQVGDLQVIYELQMVPGFDASTARMLSPLLRVGASLDDDNTSLAKKLYKGTHQIYLRTQQLTESQKGYESSTNNGYLGDERKYLLRYRYQYSNQLSYGITAEKDAGEEFFKGTNKKGFDFYSAHFYIKGRGLLKTLALGDYELRFGQGLAMWSGFGNGKSIFVLQTKRGSIPLRPYTSVSEVNYLRGAAATLAIKSADLTVFASYKRNSANVAPLDTATNATLDGVTSFDTDGYHRTASEVADKNSLAITQTGANINLKKKQYNIGASVIVNRLSRPLLLSNNIYQKYQFNGQTLLNASIDYSYSHRNFMVFGEQAFNQNGEFALLNGLLVSVDKKVDMSMVHRYFSKGYYALNTLPFAENSKPQNEHGLYTGISIKPRIDWRIDAFVDVFKFPYLKYQTDAATIGSELIAQVTYTPNRQMEMYFRFANKNKQENKSTATELDYLSPLANTQRTNFRWQIQYKLSKAVMLRARAEYVRYNKEGMPAQQGYVVYHDVVVKPLMSRWAANTRIALFNTSGYDARAYAYENDVLYSFSIPAYYYKGMRYYVNFKYQIAKPIDIYVRLAQTQYFNQTTVGSGLDEITGNMKTEIKVALRIRL